MDLDTKDNIEIDVLLYSKK